MRWQRYIWLLPVLLLFAGCKPNKAKQELQKWRVTLKQDDKRPYGTSLAYRSLPYYVPKASLETLSDGFGYDNMSHTMKYSQSGRALLILHGLDFYVSEAEWSALKDFIAEGNEVIIFCRYLDSKIEEELGHYKRNIGDEEIRLTAQGRKNNKDILTLATNPQKKYGYEGRTVHGYFAALQSSPEETVSKPATQEDSSVADNDTTERKEASIHKDTLGYCEDKINFIKFRLGRGHLTLHAAPLVLSNYFLLQPGNYEYMNGLWQTMPLDINRIYWNSYYRRSVDSSLLRVLLRYPATKLALLTSLLALLIYILFEGKRKQRIIPIIPPLRNDSVSFVETVGRLYYNKGNHNNLAAKMVQQFLEWVRTRYLLNTNLLNEHFIGQLILKSGQDEHTVRELMSMIHEIKLSTTLIDDPYLYQLYNTIQQFYKNNRS